MENGNLSKTKRTLKYILILIIFIVLAWFCLTLFELYRVKTDHRPMICFNEIKDIENNVEYSKTCYGILYKYREYYYQDNDKLSAREFTLFFKEFKREIPQNEIK